MDSLIDNLDKEKWAEVSVADRGDGYVEYSINRNPKQLDPTTLGFMISDDDGNAKSVTLSFTLANKNPLKGVGRAELKLDPDAKVVLGIDLNGDCVVLKS